MLGNVPEFDGSGVQGMAFIMSFSGVLLPGSPKSKGSETLKEEAEEPC